jgi:hypothetical protein
MIRHSAIQPTEVRTEHLARIIQARRFIGYGESFSVLPPRRVEQPVRRVS